MSMNIEEIARASYIAFANRDRKRHEELLAENFHFTSPLDNRIDRQTFYERCWPNGDTIDGFDFVVTAVTGNRVFVVYEGKSTSGKLFRNTEILTIEKGRITEVEVYFGWNIPHEAEEGSFVNP
ncbi:MAG: nuclear transport factor 2 family protein [Sneathiella sp.]